VADRRTFVLVGGRRAGANTAETLRADGFDGRLVLVTAEPDPVGRRLLAVIGAGRIGSEIAAAAPGLGAEVALIEHAATPLAGVLGGRLGEGSTSAGMHVNDWHASAALRELVEHGEPVDVEQLADAGVAPEAIGTGPARAA
jgi:NADPH-dependent 2,4-dienoyl-CoA reductase/sulfur reductase-like enzyme